MEPSLLYSNEVEHLAAGTVDVISEVRRKEAVLKTGALQNAILVIFTSG